MKKIFFFIAMAAMVFGIASCQNNESNDPVVQTDEFAIEVTEVTEYYATFDITPSDKTMTYDYIVMRASEKESFDIGWAINRSYEKHRHGGELYKGDLKDVQALNLYSAAEYVIAVYYVDTHGDRDSKEATFAPFKTTGEPVAKVIPFNSDSAEIVDYTSTGYIYYDGLTHYGWNFIAYYGDLHVGFETDNTYEIPGTYDVSRFIDATAFHPEDKTMYRVVTARVTVTGTKPYFYISGFLIDDLNVRYDLNVSVTKYIDNSEEE